METAIIGFGNVLMQDDGVGSYIAQSLLKHDLPSQVAVLDGGIDGFAALYRSRGARRLLLIDAVNGGGQAGELYCLHLDDIQWTAGEVPYSLHQMPLLAALCHFYPVWPLTTIWGIEPGIVEPGLGLTPAVENTARRLAADLLATVREEWICMN
ncbi:hydrogen uptake protein signature [Lucifera butyrica]|uniref:Hydrogen uptake protein signature n=1 Tax=Lucifera butyrica TaxID=1351585 RepID=A0A498R3A4_9FIRM|nr:hydrogenase maturation protease [Lucifera butyrica]VBB05317.1 hydrogen uptake protein signature [Lucifera butyrica]